MSNPNRVYNSNRTCNSTCMGHSHKVNDSNNVGHSHNVSDSNNVRGVQR